MANLFFQNVSKIPFVGFASPFFFCRQVEKNSPKNKKNTATRGGISNPWLEMILKGL